MMIDLSNLNESQKQAVLWNEGALLVLAGPGSGKTKVLTMRIARILTDTPEERFRILALTFTTKAATEMRTRVEELAQVGKERAHLATFHSFCADVLRQHGGHLGLKPDYSILTQPADREAVLVDAIQVLAKNDEEFSNDDVRFLPLIEKLLSNCAEAKDIENSSLDVGVKSKLKALYEEYKKQLINNNRLDFPALLYLCDVLFNQKPRIAEQIKITYPYICVDEFQDTNLAQYRILNWITGKSPTNLFVVADDDQIIYQWNGASHERLQALRHDYEMEEIQLPENYRCPPEVITLANNLIRHNSERSTNKKPLKAIKTPAGNSVTIKGFKNIEDEAAWIANDLQTKQAISESVILARTTKILEQMANLLQTNHNMNAYISTRKNEFESTPMRWLHAALRLANTRHDREQLRRVCKAFFDLEGINIRVEDVAAESTLFGGDFFRAWLKIALERSELEESTKKFLTISVLHLLDKMDFMQFAADTFAWIDELSKKENQANAETFLGYTDEKQIWNELQQSIIDAYGLENLSLHVLLQEMDLSSKSPPAPPNAIKCMTIHSSKGMEFKHVYLAGVVEDMLPSFQSIKKGEQSREMQEERRNCFVAITRCQESLAITYAERYFGWAKQPSRFLYEMSGTN